MANTVPATVPKPDVGNLMAGSAMSAVEIAKLAAAVNWAMANNGTGTPRIVQSWPARGNTTQTGALVYTTNAANPVCYWTIPDTRGATSVLCYVYGFSVGAAGTVEFRSTTGGGVTGAQVIPAAAGLIGPFALSIDASGGDEETVMWLDGTGDVTISAIMVMVEPLPDPLPAGTDSIGCVATDPAEYASQEALAADQGAQIRAAILALRTIPHVYWQWSGCDSLPDAQAVYMRATPHMMLASVWVDTAREEWDLQVRVRATNLGGGDTLVRVHATDLAGNPLRTLTLTIASASGTAWASGTMRLPSGRRVLARLARDLAGWESVLLWIHPAPTAVDAVSNLELRGVDAEDLSTALIRSVSVWGR